MTAMAVLVPLVVWLVRIVVTLYTFFTLPFYYLIQMPWQRLKRAKSCGAHLVNKGRLSDSAPADRAGVNFLEYEVNFLFYIQNVIINYFGFRDLQKYRTTR